MTNTEEPRSGAKAILSFAAAGLTLAVGITVWTWNSAVSDTASPADQTSTAATEQVADETSLSTTTSSDRRSSEDAASSSGRNSADRGSLSGRPNRPTDTTEEIDVLAQNGNPAPLGDDPYLPPDTWRGDYESPAPRQTLIEDAEPAGSSQAQGNSQSRPQLPQVPMPNLPDGWQSKLPDVPTQWPGQNAPGSSGGQASKPTRPTKPSHKPGSSETTKPGGETTEGGNQPQISGDPTTEPEATPETEPEPEPRPEN